MKQDVTRAVFEKTGMSLSVYAARNGLRIHSLYRGIVNKAAAEAFKRDGIAIEQTTKRRKADGAGLSKTAC